jgi:hypothetical protein
MPLLVALDRQLADKLARAPVDRRRRVGLLVWVHPITIMCTVPSLDIA